MNFVCKFVRRRAHLLPSRPSNNITIINYKYVGSSECTNYFPYNAHAPLADHIKHTEESEVFQSAEDGQRRSLQITRVVIERWRVNTTLPSISQARVDLEMTE